MPLPWSPPCLFADAVRHRISSQVIDGFEEWWQMPALVVALAMLAAFAAWMVRRDTAGLPWAAGLLLVCLRLATLAALVAAFLDVERVAEHEIVTPSRVALLVDSSASMSLPEAAAAPAVTRAQRALDLLDEGLLEALAPRHEASLWRFDADAEQLASLPAGARDEELAGRNAGGDWRAALTPRGYETRLGEALTRVLDHEPAGTLAAIVVLSDGGSNAGVDPLAAATVLARAGVAVHPLGIGADTLPANVRVADLVVPARVFPGDRFPATAYLQAQGLEGTRVRVELSERDADAAAPGRVIDTQECLLAADGELVPLRFDVPGLAQGGGRVVAVRVQPPTADTVAEDDARTADVEVVDRVTQVLLMSSGPGREYQFLRNVLERDASFAVDVLLGTAAPGVSQDARKILDAFPASDEALAAYDAVVGIDYDWRTLDAASQARLERWVARESGGMILYAGHVFMDAWLEDGRARTIRGLFPVDFRGSGQGGAGPSAAGGAAPRPLAFSRDGAEAEFLWLASSAAASAEVWSEFPGVFSCFPSDGPKPGATVYARLGADATGSTGPVYLAGHFYGSGSVLYAGSAELWRLRSIDPTAHERLSAQMVRHVAQGRLLRGARQARLLVERDRFPVGATVVVRVVTAEDGQSAPRPPLCRAVAPDGTRVAVTMTAEPARPGTFQGGFVASREGGWQIDVDALGSGEKLSRRIQVQLPDRELARPKLDRGLLVQLAAATGGRPQFLADGGWNAAAAQELVAAIPDRSRRDYETGTPDAAFKQRLNGLLLAAACGMLCLEWVIRRLVRLA
jgi:hypothetical protein